MSKAKELKESAVAGVGKEVKKVTATTMAAEGQPFSGVKVGPVQRRFFLLRLRARMVPAIAAALSLNRTDAVALFEETYGFDDVMYACNTRANAVEYKLSAIGDGQIFGQLLKFFSEHFDEIMKILLMLFGIAATPLSDFVANESVLAAAMALADLDETTATEEPTE